MALPCVCRVWLLPAGAVGLLLRRLCVAGQRRSRSVTPLNVLRKWSDGVNSTGRLTASVACNLQVIGASGRIVNAVTVGVAPAEGSQAEPTDASSRIACERAEDEDGTVISIRNCGGDDARAGSGYTLTVELPPQYDLFLEVRNGSIDITGIESSAVHISLSNGKCSCISLKAGDIKISATKSDIVMQKATIGDINIQAEDGSVSTERLQGQQVSIALSGRGSITTSSLYAVTANLATEEGDVSVGSCHGSISVKTCLGNVKLKSVEGNLIADTERGNVDAYLSQHDAANITCNAGDIAIRLPESCCTRFNLEARSVTVDDHLLAVETERSSGGKNTIVQGYMGLETTSRLLSASTGSGKVTVTPSSWFAAQTSC